MAIRNLINKDNLNDFKIWLAGNGWKLIDPKGEYEVLRAIKWGEHIPVIVYKRKRKENSLSISEKNSGIARQFLLERNTLHDLKAKKPTQETVDGIVKAIYKDAIVLELKGTISALKEKVKLLESHERLRNIDMTVDLLAHMITRSDADKTPFNKIWTFYFEPLDKKYGIGQMSQEEVEKWLLEEFKEDNNNG